MSMITYIDRLTKKQEVEKVYGQALVEAMYGSGFFSRCVSFLLEPVVCKSPFLSHLYGFLQKSSLSRCKIKPFIEEFHIDESEFLDSTDSFKCFNDFFIRKMKSDVRPIVSDNGVATLPADARYLFYPNIHLADGFVVKGQKFNLEELLQDRLLADRYENGSMVIARLCPTDYHRFHFPAECIPSDAKVINGPLASVNPLALKKNIHILAQNKRMITELETKSFGKILYIEVGATCVGEICQTFEAHKTYSKGDEKGYFSFGGSSLILLFEPNMIQFDQDLIDASEKKVEIRGLYGQSMGKSHLA